MFSVKRTLCLALCVVGLASTAASQDAPCSTEVPSILTLAATVDKALCLQPLTRETAARVAAAQAGMALSRSALSPQLSGQATGQASRSTRQPDAASGQLQLRLSQVVFDGGFRHAQAESARLNSLAAEMDHSAQAQTVVLQAVTRFYTYQTALSRVHSTRESLGAAQAALRVVEARFAVGEAVRVDLLQAQASVAEARAKLAQAEGTAEVSRVALYQYAGIPLHYSMEVTAAPLSCQTPAPQEVRTVLADARLDNPQVLATLHRAKAAAQMVRAAEKQSSPTVAWSANLGSHHTNGIPTYYSKSIGLTLDIPLLDGGATRARLAQATAQEELAQAQYDSMAQELELQVWQAHARLTAAGASCAAADAFLSATREAAAQSQGRYENGVGTLLDWLTSQARQASAQELRDSALADLAISHSEFQRAMGRLSADFF